MTKQLNYTLANLMPPHHTWTVLDPLALQVLQFFGIGFSLMKY